MGCAVVVLAAGCGAGTVTSRDGDDGLTGRTFLSAEITEAGSPRELVADTRIRLEFHDDGRLDADAGCNQLVGTVTIGDETLELEGMGATEMGCDPARHDQDAWLMEFLTASPTWHLSDDRLTLTRGSTQMVLLDRAIADPDRPLAGTRWVVDTIIRGAGPDGAANSVSAGAEGSAWLKIDGATFTGHTGCHEVAGTVTVDGDTLRFADTVQTDQACPPEAEEVDQVMTTIVTGVEVRLEIEAARLTLTHPDGLGVALRADE